MKGLLLLFIKFAFLYFTIIPRKKAPLLACDLSSPTWVEWIFRPHIITKQKQKMPQK